MNLPEEISETHFFLEGNLVREKEIGRNKNNYRENIVCVKFSYETNRQRMVIG